MTTKKKTTPKPGEKAKKPAAKALTEPAATATRAAMKAPKAEKAEKTAPAAPAAATPAPQAVAPSAPAVIVDVAPATPAPTPPPAPAAKAERPIITIGQFQKRLHEKGYYQGAWDGHYGPMTKHAVAHLQHANGLQPDGEPTAEVLALLGF